MRSFRFISGSILVGAYCLVVNHVLYIWNTNLQEKIQRLSEPVTYKFEMFHFVASLKLFTFLLACIPLGKQEIRAVAPRRVLE